MAPNITAPAAGNFNIANVLTVVRIILVPFFLGAFFVADAQDSTWRWIAFGIFALAMITDKLDGDLARKYGLETDFGKLADPIADKVQMAAALIALSMVHELFWWVTIVILVREIGITLWRFVGVDHVVAASKGGKLKTVVQSLAMGFMIAPLPDYIWPLEWTLMGAAVVLTVYTGLDYVMKLSHASRKSST